MIARHGDLVVEGFTERVVSCIDIEVPPFRLCVPGQNPLDKIMVFPMIKEAPLQLDRQ